LADATAVYDGTNQCFFISSNVAGADNTVGYASNVLGENDIAGALKLTIDSGAGLSQGADQENFTQTFSAITNVVKTFNGFWLLYDYSDNYYLEILAYISNANNNYLHYRTMATIQLAINLIALLVTNGFAKQVQLASGKTTYRFNVCICINISPSNGNRINAFLNGIYNSWAVNQSASFLSAVNKQSGTLISDNWTNAQYKQILELGCNCYGLIDGGYVQRSIYRIGQCGNTGAEVGSYGSQVKLTWFYIENYIRTLVQTAILVRITDGRTLSDLANDATGRTSVLSWITSALNSCAYDPDKGLNGNGMIKPTNVLAEGVNGEYELQQLSVKFGTDIQTINEAFTNTGYFVLGLAETFDSKLESTMYINFAYVVAGDISTIICTQIPVI
jgi:hypothetical protein